MAVHTIGDCIRAHREARQWTLAELADKTGLTRAVISAYECNRIRNVPSKSIVALAKAFEVLPGALYPKRLEWPSSEQEPVEVPS